MLRDGHALPGHHARHPVRRLREVHARLQETPRTVDDTELEQEAQAARVRYRGALDDDLNLPQGLGHVFDAVRAANAALDRGQVGEGARLALLALLADAD